ncbi:hypothetical protein GIB67_024572 [Kingdonia uniflora]|uniref:Uncharacterized protein n=1 Tax=Kingdonia uniflora TaxID=39325 RepID=A0A7J7LNV8_9MAGN|nr:hypothetical protein GIB67_024572 [Kingdonia uniflora]
MRSKNPKPSSKFVVSASSEESSSSDRTMNDSVIIGTVTADNLSVSSERDVGLHAGDETGREGSELNKVLGELGICREKRLNSGVNLEAVEQKALDLATRDPIRLDTQIRSSISQLFVAWKSAAEVFKLAAANHVELVRQHDTEKAALQEQFEQEKVLQREQFEKEKVLQREQFEKEAAATKKKVEDEAKKAVDITGQREMRILFFNIKREDRKIYTQLEIDMRHACDELERCKGHNACLETEKVECARLLQNSEKRVTLLETPLLDTQQRLQVSQSRLKKKIMPKRGKRAADTDHKRQMADVIAFYGAELERVENEFRRYISSCGKDVEVENNKIEDKENDNVAALSASNKKLSAKLQQCSLAVERKTLLNSMLKSEMLELQSRLNVVTVELSCMNAKILTANNESEQWKEFLKKKKLETMAANQQVLDLRKKSLEARCKDLDDELNKVKTKFYEATLLTAENVTLHAMAMLHADVEKFRTERESILAATTEYARKYDLQLARLSYIYNLMPRVMELLNAPSTVVDAAIPSPVILSYGPGESLNVVCPKREQ